MGLGKIVGVTCLSLVWKVAVTGGDWLSVVYAIEAEMQL